MSDPVSYSSSTPRHGLPLLFSGQSQKEVTVNEALAVVDFLLSGSVEGVRSDPALSPSAGQAWIVSSPATGAFTGHEGKIAGWTDSGWRFLQPVEGMKIFDRAAHALRHYSDGWTLAAAPTLPVGGATIDVEARSCIVALISALETSGIISST
ncbi:DUF2793 domain-containing protein [Novosphingobium sp. MMS21-SN21R]|uniref:DUF2793 domain-containing protein n=1 Tax=Novosphingobium sp. MMS21-SN21R TaxID=2969298 RepID=UPI002888F81D|nr:DUF2793 domain-containing protein [Novosphingobium sp. MMS21-SN21R]MDT0506793.1 DUF2793 domain-containing protein [Novosphingobium sp. MMS21-SN21R]